MLVASYNSKLEDTLFIMLKKPSEKSPLVEKQGDVVQLRDNETDEIYGYNIFNASTYFDLPSNGPVTLSTEQVESLNTLLKEKGFDQELEADTEDKFVVGYVQEAEPMEDSDHLTITQTDIGSETLQIVCGASNIKQGQKVVVAKEGAIMPDGSVIWAGDLRNTPSHGMICSASELNVEKGKSRSGILVLDDDREIGENFYK